MIDRVRNVVLTLLNKENRGFVSPSEFDRLADLAQKSIFEENFYHYNRWVNMQNQMMSNEEYGDIPKNIREKIDVFASESKLVFDETTEFFQIEANDVYRVENLLYKNRIIEEAPKSIIQLLEQENYAPPSETYPMYTRFGDNFRVYPETIADKVECFYIRKPKKPKWTYIEVQGNPIFNPDAPDFQDIELHPSDETMLIIKLMSYFGVSVRDGDIVQISKQDEMQKNAKEQ